MSMPITHLLVNARVKTGNPRRPWADAIGVDAAGAVVFVGSSAEARKLAAAGVVVLEAGGAEIDGTAQGVAAFLRGASDR